jgi:hypothetical protein
VIESTPKGETKMKRMIVISMLTAVGLFAQATGAQSGSAPVAPNSKAPAAPAKTTKVKRHKKAVKSTAKPAAAPAVKSATKPVQK